MSKYNDAKANIRNGLRYISDVNSDVIRQQVTTVCTVMPQFQIEAAEQEKMIKELESELDLQMDLGAVVHEPYEPWFEQISARTEFYYWDRYRWLLERKGFGIRVIPRLNQVTDKIIGLLENPAKDGPWERKGMVVGHVQSGKTANYTGVVCKAADVGYRLIIVIAGIHNNLRSQTQARIDEGFIGRDSSLLLSNRRENKIIGVGEHDAGRLPFTLTNTKSDFKKTTAESVGIKLSSVSEPVVLVIKKNSSTLRNLIDWLKAHNISAGSKIDDLPMLVIDDEADNASINTSSKPDEVTRINGQIRELLNLFHKRCYLGYTATPFANIFIDPETDSAMYGGDLFPRDFIVSLDPPSNYMGAQQYFGEDSGYDAIREIDDSETDLPLKHKISFVPARLPGTMEQAIRSFVLIRAIRLLRGYEAAHNSMLVNASRFTGVQKHLAELIQTYLDKLKHRIRFVSRESLAMILKDDVMVTVHKTWVDEFKDLEFVWEQVAEKLNDAVAGIRVVTVNSSSADTLDYAAYRNSGLNVIAVGGFSLSRGLTLEGLSVSYFLRNSIMYDTLLQMGRWFGYRPGYDDLCRIYMTPDARSWYSHISAVSEELRDELREMEQNGLTPKDFGLKVRSHPESLIVTARNKMRSAKPVIRAIGLAEKLIETAVLEGSKQTLEANREAARQMLTAATGYRKDGLSRASNIFYSGVPAALVQDFIRSFRNHRLAITTQSEPLLAYIRERADDELASWDVVLVTKKGAETDEYFNLLPGLSVGCQLRTAGDRTDKTTLEIGNNLKVGSRGLEKEGLSDVDVKSAESMYEKNVPDIAYRRLRERPLLMLHLINIQDGQSKNILAKGVLAYGISFPRTDKENATVKYMVNPVWWNEHYGTDDDEDMEGEVA